MAENDLRHLDVIGVLLLVLEAARCAMTSGDADSARLKAHVHARCIPFAVSLPRD